MAHGSDMIGPYPTGKSDSVALDKCVGLVSGRLKKARVPWQPVGAVNC